MKRGEVWWAHVDKRRPVVLVSRDEAYALRSNVVVAPASTTVRGYSVELKLGRAEGLQRPCVVNGDWIVTLPIEDLIERVGTLSREKLARLDDTLRFALGL